MYNSNIKYSQKVIINNEAKTIKQGQEAFERTIKATGIKKDSLSTILREKWSTDDHTLDTSYLDTE